MQPPYFLWAIWDELPSIHKLYFAILAGVTIYSFFSLSVVLVRIRSLKRQRQSGDLVALQRSMFALRDRTADVPHLLAAMVHLFGVVFFVGLRGAFWTPENNRPVAMLVLENFFIFFAFAANAFVIFLVLHLLQWFVSGRLKAFVLRRNGSYLE
ncbi:MAG TPA: hypothetical protein VK525_17975 [Candidatus Saccharimonadales bacterium]|nr:hypothetical protein [Candidatus Saccharimonadales bacterium]